MQDLDGLQPERLDAVEVGADVLQVRLEVPESERHGSGVQHAEHGAVVGQHELHQVPDLVL